MRGTLRVLRHLGPSNAKEQVTLEFERTAFVAEPRRDYVRHAAYYFIHGRTFDENLRAARNQIAADRLRAQLLDKGVAVPAPAEVRAYALRHFRVDQAAAGWPHENRRHAQSPVGMGVRDAGPGYPERLRPD